ncbi:MAG: hypothetical protein ABID35_07535 [Candidatus Margulisiibacteriota bacterium]
MSKDYATKSDIQNLTKHLDIRFDEQDKRFDKVENSLNAQASKLLEHDKKFDQLDAKMDDKFGQVLGGLDKVMGELEKARDDRVLAKAKDAEQDRRLDRVEAVVGIKNC